MVWIIFWDTHILFTQAWWKRETSVEWHCLHGVASSKKTDNLSTSTEISQAEQTAVHRSKQSVSFLPDFLSHVLYLMIAGLKECQALYNAAITCEKRELGFDARILKILILQSFAESRNLPKLLGWPVRSRGKSSQLEKGSSVLKRLGQRGVHNSHVRAHVGSCSEQCAGGYCFHSGITKRKGIWQGPRWQEADRQSASNHAFEPQPRITRKNHQEEQIHSLGEGLPWPSQAQRLMNATMIKGKTWKIERSLAL